MSPCVPACHLLFGQTQTDDAIFLGVCWKVSKRSFSRRVQGRREGTGGNFYRGPGLKGGHESEINLILSHISLFLDPKSVKFLQILGFLLKSRGVCDQKKTIQYGGAKNFTGAPAFSLRPWQGSQIYFFRVVLFK